jgi:hypothetical protein
MAQVTGVSSRCRQTSAGADRGAERYAEQNVNAFIKL